MNEAKNELLLATLHASCEQTKSDYDGEEFRDCQKEHAAQPAGRGGTANIPKPLTQDYFPAGYPWDGRTVIEWDGNTEGHCVFADMFVHVSDDVVSDEDMLGAVWEGEAEGEHISVVIDVIVQDVATHDLGVYSASSAGGAQAIVFVAKTPGVEFDGEIVEKAGIYVMIADTVTLTYGTATPMDAELVPRHIFHAKSAIDNYLYVDAGRTTKATKQDLANAIKGGIVEIDYYASDGLAFGRMQTAVIAEASPMMDYGAVVVAEGGSVADGKATLTFREFYTAEYTAS